MMYSGMFFMRSRLCRPGKFLDTNLCKRPCDVNKIFVGGPTQSPRSRKESPKSGVQGHERKVRGPGSGVRSPGSKVLGPRLNPRTCGSPSSAVACYGGWTRTSRKIVARQRGHYMFLSGFGFKSPLQRSRAKRARADFGRHAV